MPEDRMHYSDKFIDSLQTIFDLSARIDERVHLMTQQQKELERKIDTQLDALNDLNVRVRVIEGKNSDHLITELATVRDQLHKFEMRLLKLEGGQEGTEARWKSIFTFGVQLIWVILAAWLLFKLGISAPAVP
jgi:hypothetical protein